jgi:hypothetical protein
MAGVILGKRAETNARGKRVWLPGGAMRDLQREVVSTCLVPTSADGDVCGAKFVRGQEDLARQHAVKCTRQHADAIQACMARQRPEIMKPWDPELAAWLKQHKDAIMSGRMRV